jgi:hypothetical protein
VVLGSRRHTPKPLVLGKWRVKLSVAAHTCSRL